MIKAIRNHIIFQFIDTTNGNGTFSEVTQSGIVIASQRTDYSTQSEARWGKAVSVGPDCTEVREGDTILIEGLQWTQSFEVDRVKYWNTNETKVMAISDSTESVTRF